MRITKWSPAIDEDEEDEEEPDSPVVGPAENTEL